MDKNMLQDHLEQASVLLDNPINVNQPVDLDIVEIADVLPPALPGEHVFRIEDLDTDVDVVLALGADGKIEIVERDPGSDVAVDFFKYTSKMETVQLQEILESVDQGKMTRMKAKVQRGMDKAEVKKMFDLILTPASDYYPASKIENASDDAATSSEDLYDVIMRKKQAIENYGDNFLLLVGTNVKSKMDKWDKDQAATLNYAVSIEAMLKNANITVRKIWGKVSLVTGETEVNILDPDTFILIARNSKIADGKPVKFIRRLVNPEISAVAGVTVDNRQRAIAQVPVPVTKNVAGVSDPYWAYGFVGFGSFAMCVSNPYAISTCDCSAIL